MKISVNLMHYFNDHRQLVKIYIKENFATIHDIENHISETFNIKSAFYLKVENHFLPSEEDIRLLNDGDFVVVVPIVFIKRNNIEKNAVNCPENGADIAQNCDEISEAPKKPKKKKKRDKIENEEDLKKELLTAAPSEFQSNEDTNREDVKENSCKINSKKRRRCISSSKDDILKCDASIVPDNKDREECSAPMEQDSSIVKKIEMIAVNPVELISPKHQIGTDRKFLSLNDTLNFNKNISLNNTHFNNISVGSSDNLSPNCTNKSIAQTSVNPSSPEQKIISKRVMRKMFSGVGDLLTQLTNSDPGENSEAANNFVTKRKRIRTRKRKTRNLDDSEMESVCSNNTEPSVFIPPNTKAAPKLHIKFPPSEDIENIAHSTPLNIKRNNNSFNEKRKVSVNDFSIENLPPMNEVPTIDNLILFKALKLDENYCPIITNYVLGEVQDYFSLDQTVKIKILDGIDQLREPTGKFSIIPEDEEYIPNNVVTLKRADLIDAKVVM